MGAAYDESNTLILPLRSNLSVPGCRNNRDIIRLRGDTSIPLITHLDCIFKFDPKLPVGDIVFAFISDRKPVYRIVALSALPVPVFFQRYRTVF